MPSFKSIALIVSMMLTSINSQAAGVFCTADTPDERSDLQVAVAFNVYMEQGFGIYHPVLISSKDRFKNISIERVLLESVSAYNGSSSVYPLIVNGFYYNDLSFKTVDIKISEDLTKHLFKKEPPLVFSKNSTIELSDYFTNRQGFYLRSCIIGPFYGLSRGEHVETLYKELRQAESIQNGKMR